jgi:pimeloyl-ACP methyl ester carboxylesterase
MPRFTTPDGIALHFTDEGEGTPVLCLAGLTRNGADFDHVAPQLAGHRMIRLDSRGRGRSDWADPATYTIPQESADALALLDHLELERAAILGTSRGGLIAMAIAATAKDRLTGVCLNDIGPVIEQKGLDTIETYIGRTPPQKTYEEAARSRAILWRTFKDVPHQRWLEEVRAHYEETPEGLALRYDPALGDVFRAGASSKSIPDMWPLFDAFEGLPVALIRGDASEILSKETADEMARRRPDMIRAEVSGRGHVPFLDEPEAQDAIARWLDLLP